MTDAAVTRATETGTIIRIAARTTVVSGVVAAFGLGFLAAMFASFAFGATSLALVFGRINDVLVLISYLLCAPSVIALWLLGTPGARVASALTAIVGIGAIAAIVVLQWLLVNGALTFEEQIGPVSIALLGLGVWFVLAGYIGSSSGALPKGARMGLLAATHIGYPIWALWLGKRLRRVEGLPPTTARR